MSISNGIRENPRPEWWYSPPPSKPGSGSGVEYVISSITTAVSGPYTGLEVATATIKGASCGRSAVVGTVVEVVDHSGCIFDEDDMTGYTGWAYEAVYISLAEDAECDTLTPCHWAAFNRCCAPNSGTYAEPC